MQLLQKGPCAQPGRKIFGGSGTSKHILHVPKSLSVSGNTLSDGATDAAFTKVPPTKIPATCDVVSPSDAMSSPGVCP